MRLSIAALALGLCGGAAGAQPSLGIDRGPLDACLDYPGWTPTGAAICAGAATREADRRIADLIGQAALLQRSVAPAELSAAQAHWQRYRDLHCALSARNDGTQAPADVQLCRLDRSLRREAELRELIFLLGPR
jgi:uncharacterized protein YecT (DUF1311 family)